MKRAYTAAIAVCLVGLVGCATPYQEMGLMGGVESTRVDATTLSIYARGNAFTGADQIRNYVLLKAAEDTIANGYDLFLLYDENDASQSETVVTRSYTERFSVEGNPAMLFHPGATSHVFKPGETVLAKMFKGKKPPGAGPNLYDAREVIAYLRQVAE